MDWVTFGVFTYACIGIATFIAFRQMTDYDLEELWSENGVFILDIILSTLWPLTFAVAFYVWIMDNGDID